WPVGAFSDRFDRSLVMPVLGGFIALISGLMIVAAFQFPFWGFLAATAFFGGFLFTLYPSAVARAHDMFEPKDVVNVSSTLLLSFCIGAVIGPVVSSATIEFLNTPYGFYVYFSVISALYTAGSCFLRQKEIARIIPVEEQVDFMIMNDTSQMAIQIDPRSEVEPIAKEAG
ncbi:MAG: MFS transporter, partial [Deltaproteobacteria bacterium]|nr:MFS transporter [Deltaproteobacteria bacterium]